MTQPDGQTQHEAARKRWRQTTSDNGAFALIKIGALISAGLAMLKTLGVAPMPWAMVAAPAVVALLLVLPGAAGGLARFAQGKDRDGGQARQERVRQRARKALREMSAESTRRRARQIDTWSRGSH